MKKLLTILAISGMALNLPAQTFETDKITGDDFEKVRVQIGADFALQYQALEHYSDSLDLIPLGKGINLPTANLVVKADLAPGIRVNLTTYLSSRHHVEAWVKGGFLLIDALPFLHSNLLDRIMESTTVKVGVMELNFGDAHFRRSDNGRVINNPFVGNYIMESFTTAPAAEILFRRRGILLMAGLNSGSLKPALSGYHAGSGTYTAYNLHEKLAFHWKAGYEGKFGDIWMLRATLSGFHNSSHHFGSLYNGDRTGSRYYLVMKPQTGNASDVDPASSHMTGNWGPGFTDKNNSLMANLFLKANGLEIFATWENTRGTTAFGGADYGLTQWAAEGLYYFGKEKQFYGGVRYNTAANLNNEKVTRFQAVAGWKLTENIITRLEYVNQQYLDFATYRMADAGFRGLMFEAGISF